MLEVYFGNDTEKVRRAALQRSALLKAEGFVITTIEASSFQAGLLLDAVGANSLFGEKLVFMLDTPKTSVDFTTELLAQLPALASSPHTFIVIEGVLLVADKKPYVTQAAVVEEFKTTATPRFNVFALAESLAAKNKKQLWLQLQQATRAGLSAEEIIGTLWWQLKSLRLAALTPSAEAAGMKDYPYNKSKHALRNFKPGELETISMSLLAVYHDGHAGKRDIDAALEKWMLTL